MTKKLSRGEYWILESVTALKYPLHILFGPNLEQWMNKRGHGLPKDEIIDTLLSMLDEDMIILKRRGEVVNFSSKDDMLHYLDATYDMSNYADWVYYELSSKGGAVWEQFASPEWDRFIHSDYVEYNPDHIKIKQKIVLTCGNKGWLEHYFRSLQYHEYEVLAESIKQSTVEPWQATYWKTLPKGHRIEFTAENKHTHEGRPPVGMEWFDNLWYAWG